MTRVFVLQHVSDEDTPDEDVKMVGVYSSRDAAENAVARVRLLPGFREYPGGFKVDAYELDADHWREGFGIAAEDR